MTENIKIKTRSFNLDYDTFNVEQFGTWWEKYKVFFYNDYSNGIYIEIEDGEWRIFFDKINSNRTDSVGDGRQIYFSLEGSGKVGNDDYKSFINLITFALTKGKNGVEISRLFNLRFTADFINSLDKQRHTVETDKVVKEKLDKIFAELPNLQITENSVTKMASKTIVVKKNNNPSVNDFLSCLSSASNNTGKSIFVYTDSYADEDTVKKLIETTHPERGYILTSQEEQTFEGNISISIPKVDETDTNKKKQNSINLKKPSKPFLVSCAINLILAGVIYVMSLSGNSQSTESLGLLAKQSSDSLTRCLNIRDRTIKSMRQSIDTLSHPQFVDTVTKKIAKLDIATFFKTGVCKIIVCDTAQKADTVSVFTDFVKGLYSIGVCKDRESKDR